MKKIVMAWVCFLAFGLQARTEGVIKVYKTSDKTFTVTDGAELKGSETSYLIFEYDLTGAIINQTKIKFWKDKEGVWQESSTTEYVAKTAAGAKGIQYRYFYDSAAAADSGLAYLLFGPMKDYSVGVLADKSKMISNTASSLKGEAFEYEKGASKNENLMETTKYNWRLDAGITREANSYLTTKLTRANTSEMASFDEVVAYIEDVKLLKYTSK